MSTYLIEFRFIDRRAKSYMKSLEKRVSDKFKIGKKHYVPHITLVGGFTTSNESKLIRDVYELCSLSPLMHFKIKGFSTFDPNRVVFLDIKPDEELKQFRWELSQKLKNYCELKKPFDFHSKENFKFHATVTMNIPPQKFNAIKNYITSMKIPLRTNYVLVRVTLIKDMKILKEYDFLQRKMFNRAEARISSNYIKTEKLLKEYLEGRYDPDLYIHKKKSLIEKIRDRILFK